MKMFMKYACPLMMLGFPTLIFAADTLRQLNAKSKTVVSPQQVQRGVIAGAGCSSEAEGISAVGELYGLGDQFYRCVTIFDHRHQPAGTAWVAVDGVQFRVALQETASSHN